MCLHGNERVDVEGFAIEKIVIICVESVFP